MPKPKNSGLAWEPWDEQLLTKLWRDGVPKPDIAERFGRTIQSIERKASSLGLLRRPPPSGKCKRNTVIDGASKMESSMRQQDKQFIAAMLDAGYAITERKPTFNSSGSSR